MADFLAKLGTTLNTGFPVLPTPPGGIRRLLYEDMIGVATPRLISC